MPRRELGTISGRNGMSKMGDEGGVAGLRGKEPQVIVSEYRNSINSAGIEY